MSTFNELIDFTRSTTGTYLDSVVYGEELVTNGDFASDSDWIKDSGWTISNGQAQCDGTDGAQFRTIDSPLTDGKTYYISYEITAYTSGDIRVLGQGFYGISGNSVSTVTGIFVATKPYVRFYSSAFNGSIDNVSVKEVIGGQVSGTPLLRTAAINEPRLEYDASGNPLGLLIEEARTNLLQYSEDFAGSYWTKGSITISPNNAIAPDGSASADKIVPNAINDRNHIIYKNITRSTLDAFSLFVKPAGFDYVSLILQASANTDSMGVQFNLLTGTVVTSQNANGIIQDVGNGWYRVTVTPTTSTTFYYAVIQPNDGTAPNTSDFFRSTFTGNGSDGVYLWGAQFEQGAFPTSYIPTSGSAVTRTADIASLPVERFAYNQAQGSLVFYSKLFAEDNTSQFIYALSAEAGNSNNTIRLYDSGTDNRLISNIRTNAANVATFNIDSTAFDSPFKVFQSYKVNDFSAGIDGAVSGVDTGGAVPVNIKQWNFFSAQDSGSVASGHIKSIQYYPKRLSNEELELLTQPSASPTMNLTFDGQATSTLVEGLHD